MDLWKLLPPFVGIFKQSLSINGDQQFKLFAICPKYLLTNFLSLASTWDEETDAGKIFMSYEAYCRMVESLCLVRQ